MAYIRDADSTHTYMEYVIGFAGMESKSVLTKAPLECDKTICVIVGLGTAKRARCEQSVFTRFECLRRHRETRSQGQAISL